MICMFLIKAGFNENGPFSDYNRYTGVSTSYFRYEADYTEENIKYLRGVCSGIISDTSMGGAIEEIVRKNDIPYILYLCQFVADNEKLFRSKEGKTERVFGSDICISRTHIVEGYRFQFQLEWEINNDEINLYLAANKQRFLIGDVDVKSYIVSELLKDELYELLLLKRKYDILKSDSDMVSSFDFIVRSNVLKCEKDHILKDISASVDVITRLGVRRRVSFVGCHCETCNKYFILDPVFKQIMNLGIPVCNVLGYGRRVSDIESLYNSDDWKESEFWNLSEESILHMRGYNVGSKDDLTEIQRHQILEIVVDDHIKTRNGIASFLLQMININRNKKTDYTNAIERWKNDIQYILRYGETDIFTEVKSILTNN